MNWTRNTGKVPDIDKPLVVIYRDGKSKDLNDHHDQGLWNLLGDDEDILFYRIRELTLLEQALVYFSAYGAIAGIIILASNVISTEWIV